MLVGKEMNHLYMSQPPDLASTRHSLLSRIKDWDDDESWRDFFNTYWKLIYSVAIQSGLSEQEAQDVVQETILALAKKIKEFKADPAFGSFRSYLLRLTRWRIADQFAKRKSRFHATPPSEQTGTATIERVADPASLDLEHVWQREWEKNLVDAALERVKKKVKIKQYQIFDLYVVKQWPVKEVMQTLNVSHAQIYLAKLRVGRLVKKEIESLEKQLI